MHEGLDSFFVVNGNVPIVRRLSRNIFLIEIVSIHFAVNPGFDPQVLIIFGCGLLLMLLIIFKKCVVPALVRAHKSLLENGPRHAFKFCLPQTSCDCGYDCACPKRMSMRKRMSLKRIEDCPYQGTVSPPIIARECFIEQKESLDDPGMESTLVSLQGGTDYFITKSASDLRCEPSLSPASNLLPKSDERRSSCKSVRFANPSRQLFQSQCSS